MTASTIMRLQRSLNRLPTEAELAAEIDRLYRVERAVIGLLALSDTLIGVLTRAREKELLAALDELEHWVLTVAVEGGPR